MACRGPDFIDGFHGPDGDPLAQLLGDFIQIMSVLGGQEYLAYAVADGRQNYSDRKSVV